MEEGEFKKQVAVFMDKVYAKATEFGGMISGEHGIGHGKMDYLAEVILGGYQDGIFNFRGSKRLITGCTRVL